MVFPDLSVIAAYRVGRLEGPEWNGGFTLEGQRWLVDTWTFSNQTHRTMESEFTLHYPDFHEGPWTVELLAGPPANAFQRP